MLTAKDQSKDDPYSVLYSAALKNVIWKTYQSKDDLQSTKYRTHTDFFFSSSVAEPHSGKLRRPTQATKSSDYFGRARCP